MTLKKIEKVFTIRWVASNFQGSISNLTFFPRFGATSSKASNEETSESTKKATFQVLFIKLCTNFVKNLALMMEYLERITKFMRNTSNRNTTQYQKLILYSRRIQTKKKALLFSWRSISL